MGGAAAAGVVGLHQDGRTGSQESDPLGQFEQAAAHAIQVTPRVWGLIGDSDERLVELREAGVTDRVVRLHWREIEPEDGRFADEMLRQAAAAFDRARDLGFRLTVELGYHDPPAWLHASRADTRYVNQWGTAYDGRGRIDSGDANGISNPEVRALIERYVRHVFEVIGTGFSGVRVGGGNWGELSYPAAVFDDQANCYWAYDRLAQEDCPVPGWRPDAIGDDDPAVVRTFAEWYLDRLVEWQTWQVDLMRRSGFTCDVMVLYPSWGLRPGQVDAAVDAGLRGETSPERNGEVQRGHDFDRQVRAVTDPAVILTTTWLDAPPTFASDGNPTPVSYLADLAAQHPLVPRLFGENTGQGDFEALERSVEAVEAHGLIGLMWYRESELFSGEYVSLEDYAAMIDARANGRWPGVAREDVLA